MIREAMQWVANMSDAKVETIGGLPYVSDTARRMQLVITPESSPVVVRSLLGLTQLISAQIERLGRSLDSSTRPSDPSNDDVMILVEDHLTVWLVSRASDAYGRRRQFVCAKCDEKIKFSFDQFLQPEFFVIGLQANFVPGVGDIDYVQRLVSNLKAEVVSIADDNGISQTATVRKGSIISEKETIKSRVVLAPYRTFREADQPASEFVLRLKSGKDGEPPLCALFEADGGKWKLDAMANVATWISRNTKDIPVIS